MSRSPWWMADTMEKWIASAPELSKPLTPVNHRSMTRRMPRVGVHQVGKRVAGPSFRVAGNFHAHSEEFAGVSMELCNAASGKQDGPLPSNLVKKLRSMSSTFLVKSGNSYKENKMCDVSLKCKAGSSRLELRH